MCLNATVFDVRHGSDRNRAAVARDFAAITVNRWPHGYAYAYIHLRDPADRGPDKGPHVAGHAQSGRISIDQSVQSWMT
jgi:hypothetical protein